MATIAITVPQVGLCGTIRPPRTNALPAKNNEKRECNAVETETEAEGIDNGRMNLRDLARDAVLTDHEIELLDRLPGPPITADIRVTNVWIVEWLFPADTKTGQLLHDWIEERRPGWSAYSICRSKVELFAALDRAAKVAQKSKMIPVLHIEAHGSEYGLEGPNGVGGSDLLDWDELSVPLQKLNIATGCNSVVFVAACTGFAAIQTFYGGPRAPALALVGPDRKLTGSDLLQGAKEFYRRWISRIPKLDDIVDSASLEVEPAILGLEPFAVLAFEAVGEWLIKSARSDEQHRRKENMRRRLQGLNRFTKTEIEQKLGIYSSIPPASYVQQKWDELFMIDLYPANQQRFGVDMTAVLEIIVQEGPGKHAGTKAP